jgi:hypothetical protein
MAQLVLLVVAAAWAAVLIPPMLRSRVENRPNSSVTDFRRQLSTLQSTATPPRGTMRGFGRPLVQSPLQRPAAAGRPGHQHHRQASLHGATTTTTRARQATRPSEARTAYRVHGDASGGVERPHRQTHMDRPQPARMPRPAATRTPRSRDPRADVRRRRTNVLFLLVVSTACTLFLAATTSSTVFLYVFALSFLALCGYVYLLAQLRQREAAGWRDGWFDGS